jgi:hypothetical protein
MCRNIKKLRRSGEVPADEELRDAALQFIRKISGYHMPSRLNQEVFDRAVEGVAAVAQNLFEELAEQKRVVAK